MVQQPMNFIRKITIFNKLSESKISSVDVSILTVNELKEVLNVPDDDPDVIFVYPLGEKHKLFVEKYLNGSVDFENNIYQLDCWAPPKNT